MNEQDGVATHDATWWLSNQGAPAGPYSEAYVLAGLKTGAISPQVQACPANGHEWRHLAQWPQFAAFCPPAWRTVEGGAKHGHGNWAIGLGLAGMVAWTLPFLGFPVTITGLILGIKAWGTETQITGAIGAALCGLALLATAVNSMIGAFLAGAG